MRGVTVTETCSCGASVHLTGIVLSMIDREVQAFRAAHAVCRTPSATTPETCQCVPGRLPLCGYCTADGASR